MHTKGRTAKLGGFHMRDYHLVLADGSERNIRAGSVKVEVNGALSFSSGQQGSASLVVAYAPGQWKAVEVERKDDKG